MEHPDWPPLPLAAWEPTYLTLHRWLQVVGKVRLAHAPGLNHWWHAALQVTPQGLATSPMHGARDLVLTFDLREHRLLAQASGGPAAAIPLEPMTVADFYARVLALLAGLGLPTRIRPVPVEVVDTTPFPADRHHRDYDREAVERLHRILLSVTGVFARHRADFLGKSSPVHLFWGAFDLAVTRFSGRRNPSPPPDPVMGEAYSHEVISHGFWPGGDWPVGGRLDEAVFYAYAVPEPPGFRQAAVSPPEASYVERLGEFLLPYEAVRRAADPAAVLLEFMETTYLAAAERAGWEPDELRPPRT